MRTVQQQFPSTLPLKMKPCPVWRTYLGGSLLSRWRGLPKTADDHFPEDWLGSTTRASNPGREELVEGYTALCAGNGEASQEILLKTLLEADAKAYLGQEHVRVFGAQTGVLVKLLDSAIRLPIQAHPNRRQARAFWDSPFGKTESWYVLDTRPEVEHPYVLLGFQEGITREQWLRAYLAQDIAAMCGMLHRVEVQKGEMYLVEPGVPHAIGEGCLLVETQEPSDLVFRTEKKNAAGQSLSDAVCSMGIGVGPMMDCFVYHGVSASENQAKYRIAPRLLKQEEAGDIACLLGAEQTDCFEVQRLHAHAPLAWQPERFCVMIVCRGQAELRCAAGAVPVHAGEAWFLPAGIRDLQWYPQGVLEVLLCLPPKPEPEREAGICAM